MTDYTVKGFELSGKNGLVIFVEVNGEKKEGCCVGSNSRHSLEVVKYIKKRYGCCHQGAYS